MIAVRDLTKHYGDHVAVDHLSFDVNRGEILGFLGQNGAGKTTTMKILTCFMPATSGSVKVCGFDVFEEPDQVKRRIGYLPETPPLYLELLVSEYLSFIADLRGIPRSEKKQKIDRVLQALNLGEVRNRLIGNLSKGFRQRVGIAQAIIHEPEVVVMDEPTIGLDPKQVHEVRELIRSMRGKTTVIYSTHILSEVAATCDRIIIIDRGKIVAQESVGRIGTHEGTTLTEITVQKITDKGVAAIGKLKGIKSARSESNGRQRILVESDGNDDILAEISKTVISENLGLVRMAPVQLGLEEYYLDLIGAKRRA